MKFKRSVKMMRSYDYCHFEVCLSSDEEKTIEEVDDMRKEAARLADKAVKQYAEWKNFHSWIYHDTFELKRLRSTVAEIREIPESEWTPEQKSKIKLIQDINFHREREYDYEDDWDSDYPEY